MKIRIIVVAVFAMSVAAFAQSPSTPAQAAQLNRGKYLVERTGMCADCHTPMNQKGEPIKERHLGGAPLMFKPTVPVPGWVEVAPPIAGLPGFTDEQAIRFLTTGVNVVGKHAGPPMPAFRFNRSDAAAIVAYLRSLSPASKNTDAHTSTPKPTTKSGQ